jgi:phage terminase large subunit
MASVPAQAANRTRVQLPHNGWRPRRHQMNAWRYLENGGRHAELIWHRRAGKDEICLHWAAIAAHQRTATYWHMLPEAAQARKAIWDAMNPHTGRRRIDEAFPMELRATTREQEMLIKFKCGSTWQVVGSDNFNSLVGSPPAGITYSEWALAKPMARAMLRPIILENGGWQFFITTPRGKNHAFNTYKAAVASMGAGKDVFAELLTANDTGVMTKEQLAEELRQYQEDYGEEAGEAYFRQEYLCDFDAAILGAIFGSEMRKALDAGRICNLPIDKNTPVETAWDLGRTDDTAIWFFQRVRGERRFIDYYAASGLDIPDYVEVLRQKGYRYGQHWFPHDAAPATLASGGKSIVEQFFALGVKGRIVPRLGVQDGIQAARAMFPVTYFDMDRCADGIECLRAYQRIWNAEKKDFSAAPLHNWASHGADAFRMAAVAMRDGDGAPPKPKPPRNPLTHETLNELWAAMERNNKRNPRI